MGRNSGQTEVRECLQSFNAESFYGCEVWLLTLREECRLRVFENRVLRRIFGPRRDEVIGELRKLHNKELNDLYSSPNIIWVIKSSRVKQAERVPHMGERRGVYRVLVGKPEGKRSPGRSKCSWENNIKMDLQEEDGGGGMDWIDLAQDRNRWQTLTNVVMTFQFHRMWGIS